MKVLVAMNGGLKSLVTAWLLKKQGMQMRGIYFDWRGRNEAAEWVGELERKFGIPIQVLPCAEAYQSLSTAASESSLKMNRVFNAKAFFHQSFLFPKLMALREQHGFDKIATGHRVLIQEDPGAGLFRVFQNADQDLRDLLGLIGRSQKDLSALLLPLGSIPTAMFEKLAKELEMVSVPKPSPEKSELSIASEELSFENSLTFEVFTASGIPMGLHARGKVPKPGDIFQKADKETSVHYVMTDVNLERRRILVQDMKEREVSEIDFDDSAWFGRNDLGMRPLHCSLLSPDHPEPVPIRLLQYEGGQVKGFLNQPLLSEDANIFKGQLMLWVEGAEILGGGRVLRTGKLQ